MGAVIMQRHFFTFNMNDDRKTQTVENELVIAR